MSGITADEDPASAPMCCQIAFEHMHGGAKDIDIVLRQSVHIFKVAVGAFARHDRSAICVGIDLEGDADHIAAERNDRMCTALRRTKSRGNATIGRHAKKVRQCTPARAIVCEPSTAKWPAFALNAKQFACRASRAVGPYHVTRLDGLRLPSVVLSTDADMIAVLPESGNCPALVYDCAGCARGCVQRVLDIGLMQRNAKGMAADVGATPVEVDKDLAFTIGQQITLAWR